MNERLQFGKYRGKLVNEVPSGYLGWVLANVQRLNPYLRQAIEGELERRHRRPREDGATLAPQVVRTWYSVMAREFHPDRGGHDEAMKAVNRGREVLTELLESGAG